MTIHKPWKREIDDGIDGQHIAIVGYSHYRKEGEVDHDRFTNCVMNKVFSGEQTGDSFFSTVPTYFHFTNRGDFWRRVDFFNFVPEAFVYEQLFRTATLEQNTVAKTRFKNLLCELLPDKVFIFSRKAWLSCPNTIEEQNDHCCKGLESNSEDTWGTYVVDGKRILACGFRHPLYAKTDKMRPPVEEFLRMPRRQSE